MGNPRKKQHTHTHIHTQIPYDASKQNLIKKTTEGELMELRNVQPLLISILDLMFFAFGYIIKIKI